MTVASIRVAIIENLLHSVFPAFAISLVFLGFTLVVVLPPSLLVSFFISRKITRRLESLAKASHNLQAGDYASRIEVSGQDEIAQLIGLTRETVNRYLQSLQREGLLRIGRGQLEIIDRVKLEDKLLV